MLTLRPLRSLSLTPLSPRFFTSRFDLPSPLCRAAPRRSIYLDAHLASLKSNKSGSMARTPTEPGADGTPMTPIPSATLVVLSPLSCTRGAYKTLLVQRSSRIGSSFRDAVVFPGGALDAADSAACGARGEEALRLCALRETFEEVGLLLVPSANKGRMSSRAVGAREAGMTNEEWADMRKKVHDDATHFAPFLTRVCAHLGLSSSSSSSSAPPLASMVSYSRWITPKSIVRPAKRFDAHFYLTILDACDVLGASASSSAPSASAAGLGAAPADALAISADGVETLHVRLAQPQELVRLALQDAFVIFPPQFYLLADLTHLLSSCADSLERALRPLIFRDALGAQTSGGATPVETEDARPQEVRGFEPRFLPKEGKSIPLPSKQAASNAEEEEGESLYVFPLVLPGDHQSSAEQRMQAGLPARPSSAARFEGGETQQLNRVLVTPRSGGDGMAVVGVVRRGLGGLGDMQFGWVDEASKLERETKL